MNRYNWIPSYQNQISAKVMGTINYQSEMIYDDNLHSFKDLSDSRVSYDDDKRKFYSNSMMCYNNILFEVSFRGNESMKYMLSQTGILLWVIPDTVNITKV